MQNTTLIVGAGPTGLTCALELARQKQPVIIIEEKPARETISKAIGINPASLALLEAANVTSQLIAAGIKLQSLHLHYTANKALDIHLNLANSHYNFMLALPQDETERILEQQLNKLGVSVQRQTRFIEFRQAQDKIIVLAQNQEHQQEWSVDFLVGADGAHSIVRKQIGSTFDGISLPEHWNLADVRMDWAYDNTAGHGFLLKPGHIGVVLPLGGDRYRLVANHPNAFDILPKPYTIKEIIWQSDFSISCRLANRFQQDHVFLVGDAAHTHTPVGGRGMNLGIEDACTLARLITQGQWQRYHSLRYPVGKHVVALTSYLYHILALKNPLAIVLRNHLLFPLMRSPWVQKKQVQMITGT